MLVADAVDGHAPDPSDRVVVVHDAAPLQVGLDEGVLDGIGGALLVAARNRERANETTVVGPKQRFQVVDHTHVVHQRNNHQ